MTQQEEKITVRKFWVSVLVAILIPAGGNVIMNTRWQASTGDALIEATGASVGYNDAALLWHEVLHARGFTHR